MPVAKLVLGTAQLDRAYGIARHHGTQATDESPRVLEAARDAGISFLETARLYEDAEARLGRIGLSGWRVIWKLPSVPADVGDLRAWVGGQARDALATLGVDEFEAVLLHRPDELFEWGRPLGSAVETLRDDGLTRSVGVSIYEPDMLGSILSVMELDVVQAPFSIIDRRLERSGWLRRLNDEAVQVHARSVFLQGLLLASHTQQCEWFPRWRHLWDEWAEWQTIRGHSAISACLGFVLGYEAVSRIVVGVDSVVQLRELVSAATNTVPSTIEGAPDCLDVELIDPRHWVPA